MFSTRFSPLPHIFFFRNFSHHYPHNSNNNSCMFEVSFNLSSVNRSDLDKSKRLLFEEIMHNICLFCCPILVSMNAEFRLETLPLKTVYNHL